MLVGGRYETIRELGRGGFGKTYLAEDTYRRGRPKCVVKKLQPPSKLPSLLEKARKLFEAESVVLSELGNHEQIPSIYAHFEQSGEFYLVQELIDGHDLRQAFTLGDRWDEKNVISLLREILEILEVVHRHGVIHQDIKPENLIRRWKDKKLELIDFGGIKTIRYLTVNAQGDVNFTKMVGTPGYMAPEQAKGHPEICSDIFSVGMMAVQALTGYLPNQLPRHPETKAVEWHDQAIASPELAVIIDRMIQPDPSQRYQSVSEILKDLPILENPRAAAIESFNILLQEAKPPSYGVIISPQFDFARNFSESLAAVVVNQKLGYINKRGLFTIPPELEFDPISIFREGAYQFSDGRARLAIDQRWGYIDTDGRLVIKPQFDSANTFAEGLARVEIDHQYGYIDRNGNFIIRPQFESAAPSFSENMAGVEINHCYGYINKTGKVVIAPQFDTADEFGEGLARVTIKDKYGFIDKTGKVVIPAQFDVAHTFSEGLARVRVDGRYGYIDHSGKIQILPQFDDTFSFTEGLALVRNNDKYGYIDKTGQLVIPLQFDDAYPFSEGLAAVKIGNKWGFIDKNGALVVELQFEDAGSLHGGLAAVKLGGQWGYLGEEVV
jgi:serine/threonine protein kinase